MLVGAVSCNYDRELVLSIRRECRDSQKSAVIFARFDHDFRLASVMFMHGALLDSRGCPTLSAKRCVFKSVSQLFKREVMVWD